jgi:hypothetical protein
MKLATSAIQGESKVPEESHKLTRARKSKVHQPEDFFIELQCTPRRPRSIKIPYLVLHRDALAAKSFEFMKLIQTGSGATAVTLAIIVPYIALGHNMKNNMHQKNSTL